MLPAGVAGRLFCAFPLRRFFSPAHQPTDSARTASATGGAGVCSPACHAGHSIASADCSLFPGDGMWAASSVQLHRPNGTPSGLSTFASGCHQRQLPQTSGCRPDTVKAASNSVTGFSPSVPARRSAGCSCHPWPLSSIKTSASPLSPGHRILAHPCAFCPCQRTICACAVRLPG